MVIALRLCVLGLLAGNALAQSNAGSLMGCDVPRSHGRENDIVRPGSPAEISRIAVAPHGAKRNGHQLAINWVAGTQVFPDKPPYGEPLDGVWWAYCGYNSSLGVHLLMKQDEDLFTGALLDDTTGQVLPAGQKVLFSPDAKYYLAYEQPDGQDGETIKFYRRDGTKLWEGYDGILHNNGKWDAVIANFTNMQWDNQDRPQAVAQVVPHGPIFQMTLIMTKDGKWDWLPKIPDEVIRRSGNN